MTPKDIIYYVLMQYAGFINQVEILASQKVRESGDFDHSPYLLGIQEQLQLTSQSSSSLTWRHPLLRSGM